MTDKNFKKLYKQALKCLDASKYEQALALFQEAAKLQTDSPELWFDLANTYNLLGHSAEAVDAYRRVIELDPSFNRAKYMLNLLQNNSTSSEGQKATTTLLKEVKSHCINGITHSRKQDYELAITEWSQALALKPELFKIHYNVGLAHFKLGRTEEAKKSWQMAIEGDSSDAEATKALASLLYQEKDYSQAHKMWQSVLEQHPADAATQNNLILAAFRLKSDKNNAIKQFEKLIATNPQYDLGQQNCQLLKAAVATSATDTAK